MSISSNRAEAVIFYRIIDSALDLKLRTKPEGGYLDLLIRLRILNLGLHLLKLITSIPSLRNK